MKNYKVGIVGATGMVGQRFMTLLEDHPWFEVVALAASPRSAGKTYKEAVGSKWCMAKDIPAKMADMIVMDATADIEKISSAVDFIFCAVDMKKDEIKALEEAYAKAECPVVSNNSAHRGTADVPMIVPELNSEHAKVIEAQRKRLGTKRGFISVKSNCSLIRQFQEQVKLLTHGPKWLITLSPISAAKKKSPNRNPSRSGVRLKAIKSLTQLHPTSLHSAFVFPLQTVTWQQFS